MEDKYGRWELNSSLGFAPIKHNWKVTICCFSLNAGWEPKTRSRWSCQKPPYSLNINEYRCRYRNKSFKKVPSAFRVWLHYFQCEPFSLKASTLLYQWQTESAPSYVNDGEPQWVKASNSDRVKDNLVPYTFWSFW